MAGYVLYVVDTETTGLDPVACDVVEVCFCRIVWETGQEPASDIKTWLLKAKNPTAIQDSALAVNGHKREDILHLTKYGKEKYQLPEEALAEIELWIMDDNVSALDRVFIGHNPTFDLNFLRQLWKKNNAENTFPFETDNDNRVVDTKQLAIIIDLCTGRRRQMYNLGALAKAFGSKKEKSHRAQGDVETTVNLLLKVLEPLRPMLIEKFSNAYPEE